MRGPCARSSSDEVSTSGMSSAFAARASASALSFIASSGMDRTQLMVPI